MMRRREFIMLLGGAAVASPITVTLGAQQPSLPVVALVDGGSADASLPRATAFRKGLNEAGYIEGQNLTMSITGWKADTINCPR